MRTSNIFDPVEQELDQDIFNGIEPRPTILAFIDRLYFRALDSELGVQGDQWADLYLTGSLTTYQYGPTSDADISVFPNYDLIYKELGLDDKEARAHLVSLSIDHLDGSFLPGSTHPLQFFVQPKGFLPSDSYQPGIRSGYNLNDRTWFVPPEKERVHDISFEYPELYARAAAMADKMTTMLDAGDMDAAEQLWKDIHRKRQLDQRAGLGDFCEGNIVYKWFLHQGLFDRIRNELHEYIAKSAAAPSWTPETHEDTGMPRPMFNGKPVPWTSDIGSQDGYRIPDFSVIDITKQLEAFRENLCVLCGSGLTDPVYVFGDDSGHVVDGGLHPRCAKMTASWCPHIKKGLQSQTTSLVSVPLQDWINEPRDGFGQFDLVPSNNFNVAKKASIIQYVETGLSEEHGDQPDRIPWIYDPQEDMLLIGDGGATHRQLLKYIRSNDSDEWYGIYITKTDRIMIHSMYDQDRFYPEEIPQDIIDALRQAWPEAQIDHYDEDGDITEYIMSKVAKWKLADLWEDRVTTKVIYDFDNDKIILGTQASQAGIPDSKIIGDYEDGVVTLYDVEKQWVNPTYFRRLWHFSYPEKELKDVYYKRGEDSIKLRTIRRRSLDERLHELADQLHQPAPERSKWTPQIPQSVYDMAIYKHRCPQCGGYLQDRGDVYTCTACPFEYDERVAAIDVPPIIQPAPVQEQGVPGFNVTLPSGGGGMMPATRKPVKPKPQPAHQHTTVQHAMVAIAGRNLALNCTYAAVGGAPAVAFPDGGPTSNLPTIFAKPWVCDQARQFAQTHDPALTPALLILTHESIHIRQWAGARDEQQTECTAVNEVTKFATMLGAPPELLPEIQQRAQEYHAEKWPFGCQNGQPQVTGSWQLVTNKWKFADASADFVHFFDQASRGLYAPKQQLQNQFDSPDHQMFHDTYKQFAGNFDQHIETSIPGYRELQVKKGAAITSAFPGASMLDIGGSEGSWAKTVSAIGGNKTINLEPNAAMVDHFYRNPVDKADIVPHAFLTPFEHEGVQYPKFDPGEQYDIVNESMTFQFIDPLRALHVAEVKRLLTDGGLFLTDEKVITDNWDENEAAKDQWKKQFYNPDQLADKQKVVNYNDEESAVGMVSNMVHQRDLESALQTYFTVVQQYWTSGNFVGYACSDNRDTVNAFLEAYHGDN